MAADPSNTASGRTYSTSSPLGCVQDVTVAPNRYTSAVDPFLCVSETRGRFPRPGENETDSGMAKRALRTSHCDGVDGP